MSFDRQLALLVSILTAVVVFIGCTFYFALSVKVSALIAACVLIAGLAFGRGVGKILDFFLTCSTQRVCKVHSEGNIAFASPKPEKWNWSVR
jgi:hypothetical protein